VTNDEAVSTVVGALIVTAIAVGGLTLYQLTVVPNIEEQTEADLMDTIAHGMANLDADLLRQLRETSAAPLSSPITVSADTPPFVPQSTHTGALSFEPGTASTTITSPDLRVVSRNGSAVLSGSGGQWETVQNGETIDDIAGVIGLRIKIADPNPGDEDQLTIEATDADGNYAGDLKLVTEINQTDLDLVVQTREPPSPGTVVFHNHILSIHQERWDANYWIDAMLDLYWFDLQLANADKPAQLTFGIPTGSELDSEYKVSYDKRVAPGLTTTVGAGETITDYERSTGTGTISYEAQNEHFPDQTFSIEHGALVREQANGSTFLIDPPLDASAGGGVVKLGLDVPVLEGDENAVSASGVATVRTTTSSHETMSATAPNLTLSWETEHPQAWERFLDDELTDAGLTSQGCDTDPPSSGCQFAITTNASSVELEVHGLSVTDADPSDPERDVALDLRRGTIDTQVER
jgi:hypothetical protein